MTRKQFIATIAIILAALIGWYLWTQQGKQETKQSRDRAQPVTTAIAVQKPIPITINTNGYVVAYNTVEVRPQTQNIVRKVHVREGQDVKAGQLLFTLDERADFSNVERSLAQVASDRAELSGAELVHKRNQELFDQGFVSKSVVDESRARMEALRATVKSNQAAAKSSSVALSNNLITAGISGRLGAISVHPGSLAQPGGNPMVVISQIDPIAVSFAVPERELGHIVANNPPEGAPVFAQLANGNEVTGSLFFIDNTADLQTGTVRMKARFANKDRTLWPGTYVNVRMVSRVVKDAVAIPSQAIVTGPEERFVYMVQQDNGVKKQKIDVVTVEQGVAAVNGLAAGARVVVEGAQNLRPDSKVREAQAEKKREGAPEGQPGNGSGNPQPPAVQPAGGAKPV